MNNDELINSLLLQIKEYEDTLKLIIDYSTGYKPWEKELVISDINEKANLVLKKYKDK